MGWFGSKPSAAAAAVGASGAAALFAWGSGSEIDEQQMEQGTLSSLPQQLLSARVGNERAYFCLGKGKSPGGQGRRDAGFPLEALG